MKRALTRAGGSDFRMPSPVRGDAPGGSRGAGLPAGIRPSHMLLPRPSTLLRHPRFTLSALFLLLLVSAWPSVLGTVHLDRRQIWGVDENVISAAISPHVARGVYPQEVELPPPAKVRQGVARYTLDPDLQSFATQLLNRYRPDYAVIVALDPDTGRVLAMASGFRDGTTGRNLALAASYPGASVFKIITAAAVLSEGRATPDTVFPFSGKSTTLYKKNVFAPVQNKWTRNYSLTESFAKSVNAVFGRLGAVVLGGETLLGYAERFGFNRRFASDFRFDNGTVELDTGDRWQVAESAAGFTTRNTLNPLQGATIAAAVVNGGYLVAPALVEEITDRHGIPLYVYDAPARNRVLGEKTAAELRRLMRATVEIGSARKYFRGFFRGGLAEVEVGGKTGTLTGHDPEGLYEWFVGYGRRGQRKIAFAVMCISKDKWYVKPAALARYTLEHFFGRDGED